MYKGQPAGKSAGLCTSQKEKVKEILRSNELNMTRIVQERLEILRDLENQPRSALFEDTDLRSYR